MAWKYNRNTDNYEWVQTPDDTLKSAQADEAQAKADLIGQQVESQQYKGTNKPNFITKEQAQSGWFAKGGPVKDPRTTRRNYAKGGPIF